MSWSLPLLDCTLPEHHDSWAACCKSLASPSLSAVEALDGCAGPPLVLTEMFFEARQGSGSLQALLERHQALTLGTLNSLTLGSSIKVPSIPEYGGLPCPYGLVHVLDAVFHASVEAVEKGSGVKWSIEQPGQPGEALQVALMVAEYLLGAPPEFPFDYMESTAWGLSAWFLRARIEAGVRTRSWQELQASRPIQPMLRDPLALTFLRAPLGPLPQIWTQTPLRVAIWGSHESQVVIAMRLVELSCEALYAPSNITVDIGLYNTEPRFLDKDRASSIKSRLKHPHAKMIGEIQELEDVMVEILQPGSFMASADLVIHVDDPSWIAGVIRAALGRPIIAHLHGMPWEQLFVSEFEGARYEKTKRALCDLFRDERSAVAGASQFVNRAIQWQHGFLPPFVPLPSLHVSVTKSLPSPVSDSIPSVLIWRSPSFATMGWFAILHHFVDNEAQRSDSQLRFVHLGSTGTAMTFEDMAQFDAALIFPWMYVMQAPLDLIAMGVPLFLPAEPLAHKMVWSRVPMWSTVRKNSAPSQDVAVPEAWYTPDDEESRRELSCAQQRRGGAGDCASNAGTSLPWDAVKGSYTDIFNYDFIDKAQLKNSLVPAQVQRDWIRYTIFAEGVLPAVYITSAADFLATATKLLSPGGRDDLIALQRAMRGHHERMTARALAWWSRAIEMQLAQRL